jgi:Tfp pilus assembly protein PilN
MKKEEDQEINFLALDRADEVRLQKELFASLKRAGAVLIIWLLTISGILGYGLFLSNKGKSLKQETQLLEQQLDQQEDKITLVLILKERLGRIDQIINTRPDLSQPLSSFFATVPAGVSLTKVGLSEKSLTVSGTGDILSISQLAQSYTAGEQDWYQGATLKSLTKSEKDIDFNFDLLVDL